MGQYQGALVSFGGWEGLERPRFVSSLQKKCLTGKCVYIVIKTLDLYVALDFHIYSGLMPPLMRA